MPIHDWSRVPAGLFHHFHQAWATTLANTLNAEPLPDGFFALLDQRAAGGVPDVITLRTGRPSHGTSQPDHSGGIAVAEIPPRTWLTTEGTDEEVYAGRANRIAIHGPLGTVVSIVEIVSPGNKGSRTAIQAFVQKTLDLLEQGIHILIIDLFPPGARDPRGIHKLIWDEIHDEPFEMPPDRPLTLASYAAGLPKRAYVEPARGRRDSARHAAFSRS